MRFQIKILAIFGVMLLLACEGLTPEDVISNMPQPTVVDTFGIQWVEVPAGWFTMGSTDADAASNEAPEHDVYLDGYYISKYEVTNAQFCEFLNDYGNSYQGHRCISLEKRECDIFYGGGRYFPAPGKDTFPVVEVTWYGAKGFSEWSGGRLPTEAEWEKAARGIDMRKYPWGNDEPTREHANYNRNVDHTTPVGSFPRDSSAYGCLDMAGNVSEWCADWYDDTYYEVSPDSNPEGPVRGSYPVKRGGSWWSKGENQLRCAFRDYFSPTESDNTLGFRPVKDSL